MCSANSVAVDRNAIIEATKAIIEDIDNDRKKLQEEAIQKRMNRKLFPCKTREKAIEEIRYPSRKSITIADIYRRKERERAEILLKAAEVSEENTLYLGIGNAAFVKNSLDMRIKE